MINQIWAEIERLIEKNDIESVVQICQKQNLNNYSMIEKRLLEELSVAEECTYRNTIAIILSDLKCDKAVPTLISLINDIRNWKCNATMIYALEGLACEKDIMEIVHILNDGNYEAKWNLLSLIKEKENYIADEEKKAIFLMLNKETIEESLYRQLLEVL